MIVDEVMNQLKKDGDEVDLKNYILKEKKSESSRKSSKVSKKSKSESKSKKSSKSRKSSKSLSPVDEEDNEKKSNQPTVISEADNASEKPAYEAATTAMTPAAKAHVEGYDYLEDMKMAVDFQPVLETVLFIITPILRFVNLFQRSPPFWIYMVDCLAGEQKMCLKNT